jgi:hypothetical protein
MCFLGGPGFSEDSDPARKRLHILPAVRHPDSLGVFVPADERLAIRQLAEARQQQATATSLLFGDVETFTPGRWEHSSFANRGDRHLCRPGPAAALQLGASVSKRVSGGFNLPCNKGPYDKDPYPATRCRYKIRL